MASVRRCALWMRVAALLTACAAAAPAGQPPAPAVVVESALPTHKDFVPQLAFDGKPDTYFESARPPKAGDTFTMAFAEAVRAKRVEVLTGRPDGQDALAAGVLETSADGKTFVRAAAFSGGAAKADLGAAQIKALRVRVTADGADRLAIREIVLRAERPIPVFTYPIEVFLDASEVPDMKDWCERAQRTIRDWYPTIAEALAGEGYTPPRRINLVFKKGDKGIASTAGANIVAYDGWFKAHPGDVGALIHEAVHVVQSYPRGSPGWLVEGIADYVRCWVYEPTAPRPRLDPARIKYTDAYKTTAAFLAWLVEKYDKTIVTQLNTACRKARYKDELFKESTGKDLETLWEEFRKSLPAR